MLQESNQTLYIKPVTFPRLGKVKLPKVNILTAILSWTVHSPTENSKMAAYTHQNGIQTTMVLFLVPLYVGR
jgi:hypothetical protein